MERIRDAHQGGDSCAGRLPARARRRAHRVQPGRCRERRVQARRPLPLAFSRTLQSTWPNSTRFQARSEPLPMDGTCRRTTSYIRASTFLLSERWPALRPSRDTPTFTSPCTCRPDPSRPAAGRSFSPGEAPARTSTSRRPSSGRSWPATACHDRHQPGGTGLRSPGQARGHENRRDDAELSLMPAVASIRTATASTRLWKVRKRPRLGRGRSRCATPTGKW